MLIYIINFIINMLFGYCILWGIRKEDTQRYKKRKKIYLIFTTIQLSLISGLRSTKMTYDTKTYQIIFNKTPNDFANIFNNRLYVETGFAALCTLIKILGGNFQTLLIVSSFFIVGSCCVFIYRHSANVLLSVFIIISFPFYYSSFDIIRHFIALSFFLLGYKYIEKNKFIPFLIYIIIGGFFHSISYLFIFFYFIKYIKFNWITFLLMITTTILCFFKIDDIAVYISRVIHKGNYLNTIWVGVYGGGIKTAIMYGAIFVIMYFQYKNIKIKSIQEIRYITYVFILFLFSIIFINARIMTRMIMATVPLLSISAPNLLCNNNTINTRNRNVYLTLTIFIGIFYHGFMLFSNWQNVVPYIPYWL